MTIDDVIKKLKRFSEMKFDEFLEYDNREALGMSKAFDEAIAVLEKYKEQNHE